MNYTKLFLPLIVILLVSSIVFLAQPIDAKKSAGTRNTTIGSDKVCGDRLCSEIEEESGKRGSVSQQSRFSMGGVSQQGMALSGSSFQLTKTPQSYLASDPPTELRAAFEKTACDYGDGLISNQDYLSKIKFESNENGIFSYNLRVSLDESLLEDINHGVFPTWLKNSAKGWCYGVFYDFQYLVGINYIFENANTLQVSMMRDIPTFQSGSIYQSPLP